MRFLMIFTVSLIFAGPALAQSSIFDAGAQKKQAIEKLRTQTQEPMGPHLAELFLNSTRFYNRYSLEIRWEELLKAAVEENELPSEMAIATATRSATSLLHWSENFGAYQQSEPEPTPAKEVLAH